MEWPYSKCDQCFVRLIVVIIYGKILCEHIKKILLSEQLYVGRNVAIVIILYDLWLTFQIS